VRVAFKVKDRELDLTLELELELRVTDRVMVDPSSGDA
jgi:hypothetical protein